jgi:hypothetical protein
LCIHQGALIILVIICSISLLLLLLLPAAAPLQLLLRCCRNPKLLALRGAHVRHIDQPHIATTEHASHEM